MKTSSPFFRAFLIGGIWFIAVAFKMLSRYSGPWNTYPPSQFIVLVIGWIITASLLGVAAKRFEKLRTWWGIGAGTVAGSLIVMGSMLLIAQQSFGPSPPQSFRSTDEMMEYFATMTTKWVKKDRGIQLDYSVDSIKIIEEELARVSKEVNRTNPQKGTFGLATGYGAYIGEVFRRRDGGSWALDHPVAGPQSYPLTTKSNNTIFPVGWCWRRLTVGEEDNVYHKALVFSQRRETTNSVR